MFLVLSLFVLSISTPAALANVGVLDSITARVAVPHQGRRVIALFDLDDTLFDSRTRSVRIFREFAALAKVRTKFPSEAGRLALIRPLHVLYKTDRAFLALQIANPEFTAAAMAYWKLRFFTGAYAQYDEPITGAVAYVNRLWQAGADIVYLSGRPQGAMGAGTYAALRARGFPVPATQRGRDARAWLFLKENPEQPDLDYKKLALLSIGRIGEVLATFENEPRNANLFAEAFPRAYGVFLTTISAENPSVLLPGIVKIPHFWYKKSWLQNWNEDSAGSQFLRSPSY